MPPPHPEAVAAAASGPAGSSLAHFPSSAQEEEPPKAASGADDGASIGEEAKHLHHHLQLAPPFSPFLLPYRNAKVLTLIRHAQGYHNAAGERDRESYKLELYRDAHLTSRGWKQALAAGRHWRSVYSRQSGSSGAAFLPRPELVVVSPLTRTLETASAIFGREAEGKGGGGGGGGGRRPVMAARAAVPGRVAPAPAFFSDLPFVAHELCREESGLHPCDGRISTSEKRAAFPAVDFSLIDSELDPLYDAAPPGQREPKESVKARALEFARWLLTRPERHIAVVSHAGFLHFFAQAVGAPRFGGGELRHRQQQHGEALTAPLTKWFENAEARVVVLADAGGGSDEAQARGAEDLLAYAGGGFEDAEEEDEEKR